MSINSKLIWIRFEQEFPWQLEESFYWFLQNIEINRFAFESIPQSNLTKTLKIWLPISDWSETDLDNLSVSLQQLANIFGFNLPIYLHEKISDEDWSLSWKKHWKPDPIGDKILILPNWINSAEQFSERMIIRLDPGFAFGTGGHPTTRLCLEEIEKAIEWNKKVESFYQMYL